MKKIDIIIIFFLSGILSGMALSLFKDYRVSNKDMIYIINNSCYKSEISILSISFFGRIIKVECVNGQIQTYNLLKWNSSDKNNNR